MSNDDLLKKLNDTEADLNKANDIIIELEDKIAQMISLSALAGTEKIMLDIIEREINRINQEQIVLCKMSKDDLRTFDVLAKDFVAIRGKIIPEKPKETESQEDDIDNLIKLVKGA